jgi:metallo-beta-lactamase class B
VTEVGVVAHGDTLRVGDLKLVAHLTPGHSPGGTTWTWSSCEGARCLAFVYADSQTPVSDDGFRFSEGGRVAAFERGLATIAALPCEVLVTPHPGASGLWERIDAREAGDPDALVDCEACRQYADRGREQLARRLTRERGQR